MGARRPAGRSGARPVSAPTVLIGLGAHKAGTTWLYEALRVHPECHLRRVKELRYFTALARREEGLDLDVHERAVERLEARLPAAGGERSGLRMRLDDLRAAARLLKGAGDSDGPYLDYLTEGRTTERLVGDISPDYGTLPAAMLRRMAAVADDVRFVYLWRDPVERLWSHVRMRARNLLGSERHRDRHRAMTARVLDAVLEDGLRPIADQADYRATIERLRDHLPARRLLVASCDEAFTDAGFARICRFFGIAERPALARRIYEGWALPPTPEQRERMEHFLTPQYDYLVRNLGFEPGSGSKHLTGV